MKNRLSKLLYSYWNEVRGDRLAPRRFEIEPARIAAVLPDAFILERSGDMDIRYRLAGTRIIEHFGSDFRGQSFFDGFVLTDRRIVERQMREMINQGGGALLEITSAGRSSGRKVTHECLILPLVHMRETVDRFVGCISIGDAPDWLGDEPLVDRSLTAYQALLPEGPAAVLPFPQPTVLDENIRTARIVRSNRRYFRVYDGGLAGNDKT